MMWLGMSFSYFMKPSLKSFGHTKFNDDFFLTLAGMAAFFFSALAKFGWGAAQDLFGFKTCFAIILAI